MAIVYACHSGLSIAIVDGMIVKLIFGTLSLVCQSLLLYMVIRCRCLSAGYIATANHNDL